MSAVLPVVPPPAAAAVGLPGEGAVDVERHGDGAAAPPHSDAATGGDSDHGDDDDALELESCAALRAERDQLAARLETSEALLATHRLADAKCLAAALEAAADRRFDRKVLSFFPLIIVALFGVLIFALVAVVPR